jgi:hypothetical protein
MVEDWHEINVLHFFSLYRIAFTINQSLETLHRWAIYTDSRRSIAGPMQAAAAAQTDGQNSKKEN